MIKKTLTTLTLTFAMVFSFGGSAFADDGKIASTPSYSTVTEVEDWGASITKVIVNLGEDKTLDKGSVSADTFKVQAVKYQKDGKTLINLPDKLDQTRQNTIPLQGEERTITNAYVSDKDGNPVSSSNFVTLELKIGPEDDLGSVIYSTGDFSSDWAVSKYKIIQQKDISTNNGVVSGINITDSTGGVRKIVDDFKTGSFTNAEDNVTLNFADYTPTQDNKKNPLIIWLHGMGEGGVDATIPISGNKACNFASKQIQAYFDGAYVLAPQAPTFWMDGITGGFGDGTSKYEKSLMSLIKDYVSKHNDIDTDRIYIGGDSNGGYMTMVMVRDYGDYFAAAMPTCEALQDVFITDAQIDNMKNVPIWFTAAKSDILVYVDKFTKPTYDRLINAGAKNVHISLLDKVLDTTGLYNKQDGSPYEYFGHSSWIYVYNNKSTENINGKTTTIMEWLAAQTLKTSSSTGWGENADGTWNYVNTDGSKSTGWINDNGTWY
jgi:predicted peptidase